MASRTPAVTEGNHEIVIITRLTLYVTKLLYFSGKVTARNLSKAIGIRTSIKEFLKVKYFGKLEDMEMKYLFYTNEIIRDFNEHLWFKSYVKMFIMIV